MQLAGLALMVFGLAHLSKGAHEGGKYQRLVGPVVEDLIAKDRSTKASFSSSKN